MPRIQYLSGILKPLIDGVPITTLIKPSAPYLALCGNTLSTQNKNLTIPALKWLSENYETVFWIPGHGEVSGAPVTRSLQAMYSIVQKENLHNIHIGNRLSKGYDGFHVLATSLPLPIRDNSVNMSHESKMPFTVVDLYGVQKRDYYWLMNEIMQFKLVDVQKQPLLILTDGPLKVPQFTLNVMMNSSNYRQGTKPFYYAVCGSAVLNHRIYNGGIVSCSNNNHYSYSVGNEIYKPDRTIEMLDRF